MTVGDLDRKQGFALLAEMTSARNLLGYGVRTVRTAAFIETTRDPILTMLSIGVEKLYKVTLGLIALDIEGRWPTKAEMRALGHGLEPMHQRVMDEIRSRTAHKSEYVRTLIAEVESDPCVVPIIKTLDLYGRMGRFYYLDQLGEAPQPANPDDAWQQIEQAALNDNVVDDLYHRAMAALSDGAAWEAFTRALHGRIADSVERLWTMVAVVGRNHALGVAGDSFGFEIHPDMVGRQ